MQNLVDKIYKGERRDKITPLSKFEFEQRDIRNKLDLADIYLQLEQIKTALAISNIVIEPFSEQERAIVEMVQEDRKNFQVEMETLKYEKKMAGYKNGSLLERGRRMFYGIPQHPNAKTNRDGKMVVEVDATKEQQEVINNILNGSKTTVEKTAFSPVQDFPDSLIMED